MRRDLIMEQAKKSRKQNRTHDEIKDALNAKIAYHHIQINQINARLAALDTPKQPRKARASYNKALAGIKAAGITPEELEQIINERKAAAAV
jgi:phage shock protein A